LIQWADHEDDGTETMTDTTNTTKELPKAYRPADFEAAIYERWLAADVFAPDGAGSTESNEGPGDTAAAVQSEIAVRPVEVLIVGDGRNIHVRRLAAALAERGLRVDLACFEGDPIAGVRIHLLGSLPPALDRRYLFAIPALARLIRQTRPGLVHASFVSSYGLMTALATMLVSPTGTRPPVLQSALGSDLLVAPGRSRIKRWLATLTLRRADLITYNSASLREVIERLAPRARTHRFIWGPERHLLESERQPERLALSTRRMEPDMRVELVVAAWRRAREIAPATLDGWRLVVTHQGSQADLVHAAAGDDPTIDFVGVLPYDELQRMLLRARMMISSPTSDATSAALMDAFAAGLVPVVNAIPGALEWVDTEVGEIVSRDPTADELAAAIVRAAGRPDDPDRARARARDIVWEDEVPRLIAAYRTLL
jgi:glycosyltransferase involved in cell wall biosynthesis